MRIVDELPAKGGGRPPRSGQRQALVREMIADGRVRLFEPGVDYEGAPRNVRTTLSHALARMPEHATHRLVTRMRPEGVYVQVVPR